MESRASPGSSGILKGLADAGVDLTTPTSSSAPAPARWWGRRSPAAHSLDALYDGQLRPPDKEIGAKLSRLTLLRLVPPLLIPGSSRDKRARIGKMALKAHAPGGERRIEVIHSRIGVSEWPDRELKVTAVEAETGELVVFDRDSGVDLTHAVAASCAVPLVWPAVTIDGTHYIDGGVRSTANVDLAKGADEVVVLAPLPQAFSKATSIKAQLARTGADAHGRRHSRPGRRSPTSARTCSTRPSAPTPPAAGLRQAADVVDKVRAAWTVGEEASEA